jgi:tRNA G18 (ribose-2'-O)-methylase SpoU
MKINKIPECILVLDNIRSVENTGSIFRTAECFGVSKIILVGTTPAPVDRFGRKRKDLAKVALGAEEFVKWEQSKNLKNEISNLKKAGYKIIALEQSPDSKKLSNFKTFKLENFALVVGNEVAGVSKEVLKLADEIVEIPMRGKKESLNVAVATGIALFKLCK